MIITQDIAQALVQIAQNNKTSLVASNASTEEVGRADAFLTRVQHFNNDIGKDVKVSSRIALNAAAYVAVKTAKDSGVTDVNTLKTVAFDAIKVEAANFINNPGNYSIGVNSHIPWMTLWTNAASYNDLSSTQKRLIDTVVAL